MSPKDQLQAGNITMKEHGLKHFRVLVADDDSSILDFFQQVLSRVETDPTVHLETGESESKLFQENASSQSIKLFDVVTCQQGDEAVDAVKSSIKEDRPFSASTASSKVMTRLEPMATAVALSTGLNVETVGSVTSAAAAVVKLQAVVDEIPA